jgi:hypothetical protein
MLFSEEVFLLFSLGGLFPDFGDCYLLRREHAFQRVGILGFHHEARGVARAPDFFFVLWHAAGSPRGLKSVINK